MKVRQAHSSHLGMGDISKLPSLMVVLEKQLSGRRDVVWLRDLNCAFSLASFAVTAAPRTLFWVVGEVPRGLRMLEGLSLMN